MRDSQKDSVPLLCFRLARHLAKLRKDMEEAWVVNPADDLDPEVGIFHSRMEHVDCDQASILKCIGKLKDQESGADSVSSLQEFEACVDTTIDYYKSEYQRQSHCEKCGFGPYRWVSRGDCEEDPEYTSKKNGRGCFKFKETDRSSKYAYILWRCGSTGSDRRGSPYVDIGELENEFEIKEWLVKDSPVYSDQFKRMTELARESVNSLRDPLALPCFAIGETLFPVIYSTFSGLGFNTIEPLMVKAFLTIQLPDTLSKPISTLSKHLPCMDALDRNLDGLQVDEALWKISDLAKEIEKLLGDPTSMAAQHSYLGICFDYDRYMLTYQGQSLILTSQDRDLFQVVLALEGKDCTVKDLKELNEGETTFDSSIQRAFSRLKTKLNTVGLDLERGRGDSGYGLHKERTPKTQKANLLT